jgi:hypothetical protein
VVLDTRGAVVTSARSFGGIAVTSGGSPVTSRLYAVAHKVLGKAVSSRKRTAL